MSTYDKIVGATATGELPPAVLTGIEANVTTYTPSASRAAAEYWVSPSGSDTAAGTLGAPWQTIARAVQSIPDVIRAGHTHTINLLPGTWDERLIVENRTVLGTLIVQGTTETRSAHEIRDAVTRNVQGHYIIRNIHSGKTVPGIHFHYAASGPRMEVLNCSGSGEVTEEPFSSGNQGVLADYGSGVIVENSSFSYKDYALRANYGSNLVSRENTGTGNTHGIGARFGGHIEVYGTVPHGYDGTATFSSGGVVVHETGGHVGVQRYNAALGKRDTYGLVEQVSLQGQGNITPTKRWASRGPTTRQGEMSGGGGAIAAGSTLRTHFQVTTGASCYFAIDVTAMWAPVGSSARRFAKVLLYPRVDMTSLVSGQPYVLASSIGGGGVADEQVTITHSGANGIFYLDFTPNGGSNNGQYGLDIEVSNMRHQDAPIMLGAEVVTL